MRSGTTPPSTSLRHHHRRRRILLLLLYLLLLLKIRLSLLYLSLLYLRRCRTGENWSARSSTPWGRIQRAGSGHACHNAASGAS
ncbi:MAG: hypothetical protein ACK59A_16260 [Cyanobacteriota bacterium]